MMKYLQSFFFLERWGLSVGAETAVHSVERFDQILHEVGAIYGLTPMVHLCGVHLAWIRELVTHPKAGIGRYLGTRQNLWLSRPMSQDPNGQGQSLIILGYSEMAHR